MDKIQDAIAKARAARQDGAVAQRAVAAAADMADTRARMPHASTVTPQRSAMAAAEVVAEPVVPAGPDPVQVAASWAALEEFQPAPGRLRRNRIMTFEGGREAMDFDVLRTRILQQARANGWRRIAITSPGPGCGKSTMVLNLAFSLARQPDQRAWVCEMDMRRPVLTKMLGVKDGLHIADALTGASTFEANTRRIGETLMVSTIARPVSRAAEILQSEATAAALDDVMARYDPTIALFDMPPLLAGDDTMAFLSQVDCVILLAAAEQSTIKQIDACERDIASQTNVMGVVLNKCRYMDRDASYGYYE